MTHLSIVIPVLNESSLIDELLRRVTKNVETLTKDFEIILVDDGSQDGTWIQIENEAKSEKRIKGLKFSRNFGHHYAITAGLQESNGEWVVVMDGDLQDRPEVIPDLYRKAQEGFDVVFVSRRNRPEKFHYQLIQKLFYFILINLSGIQFDSRQANFSIINRKVVNAYLKFTENSRFYNSTITWLGFKRSFIEADHGTRHSGAPSYTFRTRIKLATDIILSFSERPLKFAVGLGLTMSTLSILMAVFIIYGNLKWGFQVIGWSSLITALFFSTGILLIVLGVLGIYIGKIYVQVKNRPLYIIEDKIESQFNSSKNANEKYSIY